MTPQNICRQCVGPQLAKPTYTVWLLQCGFQTTNEVMPEGAEAVNCPQYGPFSVLSAGVTQLGQCLLE